MVPDNINTDPELRDAYLSCLMFIFAIKGRREEIQALLGSETIEIEEEETTWARRLYDSLDEEDRATLHIHISAIYVNIEEWYKSIEDYDRLSLTIPDDIDEDPIKRANISIFDVLKVVESVALRIGAISAPLSYENIN